RPGLKRNPVATTALRFAAVFLPLPVLMPASPDRVAVLDQNLTLLPDVRRGESAFVVALPGQDVPTAVPPAFAEVYMRRVGVVVREDEDAVAAEGGLRHLIVRQQRGHATAILPVSNVE